MRDLSKDSIHLSVRDAVQLFIDNVLIESAQNVTRRWHSPERKFDHPVIRKDRPWENILYFTYSNHCVRWDQEESLFKCWYEDLEGPFDHLTHHFGMFSRQLYAESENGEIWRKPDLDVIPYKGGKTNIVIGDPDYGQVHSASVIIDPHPRTAEERYKSLYTHIWDRNGEQGSQIECAYSPDGIHWSVYDQRPVMGTCGSQLGDVSLLFYNEDSREFVQNTRHCQQMTGVRNPRNPRNQSFNPPHEPHNFAAFAERRIWQSRSHDFIHWSEPVLIAACDDDEDNLDESFYGMAQFKVGDVFLGTVGVLHKVDNMMDVQLLVSRDGVRWNRTAKRQPFFAPRGPGFWDAFMVSLVSPPVPVGDELWFFHGGTNYHHDWFFRHAGEKIDHPEAKNPHDARFCLGLATLRKAGFAGLYANELREGIVVTRYLKNTGKQLIINGRCDRGGSIRVEVVDVHEEVIEPCTKENCDPLTSDSTDHTVTWRGSSPIPRGSSTERRADTDIRKLRFYLRNAELFSFRFEDLYGS